MSRRELSRYVSRRTGLPRDIADQAVAATFEGAAEYLRKGIGVTIPNFGRFESRRRAARLQGSGTTGVVRQLPERSTVTFTSSSSLRRQLNRSS